MSSIVRCNVAIEARRWKDGRYQYLWTGTLRTASGLTWSSELLAFSMARSISLSPSPLALYASRISRRLGGGGCEDGKHVRPGRVVVAMRD